MTVLAIPLQASAAVPAGFVLFVVAWIFLVIVAFGFPFSPKYRSVGQHTFQTMAGVCVS